MAITSGQIIKNPVPGEPVSIIKTQQLGSMVSIMYTGVNSNQTNTVVIDNQAFNSLEVLTAVYRDSLQINPGIASSAVSCAESGF